MRPTTTQEFRELALLLGATCTEGSMMFGTTKRLASLSDAEMIPPFASTVSPMVPMVKVANKQGKLLTLEILCECFSSPEHYYHVLQNGTIVGNEIDVDPVELRPTLHTLLPLDDDGIYRNAGVELEFQNLIDFGEPVGTGFWAAHLAGKIWIPRDAMYREYLRKLQSDDEEFVKALVRVAKTQPVTDYGEYYRLHQKTLNAKAELTKIGR